MPTVVTVEEFQAEFPAFAATDAGLVSAKLDAAERKCDADAWGDLLRDGVMNLAAHLIATDPRGQSSRLVSQNADTTYLREYLSLQQMTSSGDRLL